MKKQFTIPHAFIFIFVIILLVSMSIAVSHPSQSAQNPPPTEETDLALEVGSTKGITVLAFIIAGVITLPLLASGAFSRKKNSPRE